MPIGCCRFAITFLVLFTNFNSIGQQPDSCVLKLKTYRAKACINELLTAIVKSHKSNYNEGFYTLSLFKGIGHQTLTITTSFWKKAPKTDYKGIIKIKKASFLLRGEFDDGILFKETMLPLTEIRLLAAPPVTSEFAFFHEPVLQGYFSPCFISKPVYIEVYTKTIIKGYKINIPNESEKPVIVYKE